MTEPTDDQADLLELKSQVHENRSRVVKALLVVVGSVCVVLGVLGVVLPIVPTTPFLLLAAICYANSSERFYIWLLTNRVFGHYIRDWREHRGIALPVKLWIIFVLASTMFISGYFFVPVWQGKLGLAIIGSGISIYILRLPTKRGELAKD